MVRKLTTTKGTYTPTQLCYIFIAAVIFWWLLMHDSHYKMVAEIACDTLREAAWPQPDRRLEGQIEVATRACKDIHYTPPRP
ncbi:MAG: hypothetical protein OEW11_11110 [Nitrospirota bacterium]|nr:hypothetical protein [Nitrospirota bacterium]